MCWAVWHATVSYSVKRDRGTARTLQRRRGGQLAGSVGFLRQAMADQAEAKGG